MNQLSESSNVQVWKSIDAYQTSSNIVKAGLSPHVNDNFQSSSTSSVVNSCLNHKPTTSSTSSSIFKEEENKIKEFTTTQLNGMPKSSLDLNNNANTSSAASVSQQTLKQFQNCTNTNKKFTSTPLNLITESEAITVEQNSNTTYTRPPILKDQPKTSSLSSTASSGIQTGSFDSTLSIENLTSAATTGYLVVRADSIDKVNTIFNKPSRLVRTDSHGKISKLSHKTNAVNLNKTHMKSIGLRSQSEDETSNFNMKATSNQLDNQQQSASKSSSVSNSKTGSINNVSNLTAEQSFKLNQDMQQLLQQQEIQRQNLLKKYAEDEKKSQEKKRNQIQNQDFVCNKIIEEEHTITTKPEYDQSGASSKKENSGNNNMSGTTLSPLVRQRLRENIFNKWKREQNGIGITGGPSLAGGVQQSLKSWQNKLNLNLAPLKKAASEPNLKNKTALKQSSNRRCSPHTLLKKKQKRFGGKGPMHLVQSGDSNTHSAPVSASSSMESSTPPNSKPESIPGSPPTFACGSITTGNSASSTPQYNEPSTNIQSSPYNENHLYSSPSLPNISRHYPNLISDVHRRFYPAGASSTSPTQLYYHQKMRHKHRFEHTIEKETSNLVGSIASNQSFINDPAFINSAVAASFRRAHCSPLLSNSLDNPISQRDSPPAAQSAFQSTPYSPYAVVFKPLVNKKLNRTYSAPSEGFQLGIQKIAKVNQSQNSHQPCNSPLASHPGTYSLANASNILASATAQPSVATDSHQQTLLKLKQNILTKQKREKSQSNLMKPSSFDETPYDKSESNSNQKRMINERNVDSGSGSFDENYNETSNKSDIQLEKDALIQRQLLIDQIEQQLNQINQMSSNQQAEDLINQQKQLYIQQQQQQQLMLFLQLQQQSPQFDPAILLNSINNSQKQQQSPLANINYAKLLMSSQLQQSNGMKRALSQPMVSTMPTGNLFTNQLFSPASLFNQPSLTSLVAPFSCLNLSHNNINLINQQTPSSTVSVPACSPDSFNENLTALITDEAMLKHDCPCGNPNNHLESSNRLKAIYERLSEIGLLQSCFMLPARKAEISELEEVHSPKYCRFFASEPLARQKFESTLQINEFPIKSLTKMNCGGVGVDNDTYWSEMYTWSAVRAAAGCVIDLSIFVAKNKLKNGFALVRPPGHHAEFEHAGGFCYFNSVAIAAKQVQKKS